jgi:ParB/RepB/Spo0J family partition protein
MDPHINVTSVKLTDISPPTHVHRVSINPIAITELAESIKEVGLIHPITLNNSSKPYEIVQGHRRYLACRQLKLTTIPAVLKTMTPQEIEEIRAVENIQREDLNPVEQALAYDHIRDKYQLSPAQLSQRIAKSQQHVRDILKILEMPPDLQSALATRSIGIRSAIHLSQISDDQTRTDYTRHAIDNGITEKVARSWLDGWRRMQGQQIADLTEPKPFDPNQGTVTYFTCSACRRATDLRTMHHIYLCPDCHAEAFPAQKT